MRACVCCFRSLFIRSWDVVNEAIYDGNNASQFLKPSYPWFPAVPDYIDTAFKAARAADPTHKVKLFYNEYSAEGMTPKSDKVYALVKDMRERNIPIDGVGLQMHIGLDTYQESPAFLTDVAKNMARLHELSLEVHITEMDIKCVSKGSSKKCTPERLLRQAKLYADLLRVCLDAPNCKSFETWDFVDKYSWIGESIEPLPFSSDYVAKPAVAAMINEMLKKH
jgi:endo-1,4-beta-xylanase